MSKNICATEVVSLVNVVIFSELAEILSKALKNDSEQLFL
jgi:hypothetical protein